MSAPISRLAAPPGADPTVGRLVGLGFRLARHGAAWVAYWGDSPIVATPTARRTLGGLVLWLHAYHLMTEER